MDTPKSGWLKENVGPLIALEVVAGGFAYLFAEIWWPLKNAAAVVALIGAVVYFYYGSSKGSQAKDETNSAILEKQSGVEPAVK